MVYTWQPFWGAQVRGTHNSNVPVVTSLVYLRDGDRPVTGSQSQLTRLTSLQGRLHCSAEEGPSNA